MTPEEGRVQADNGAWKDGENGSGDDVMLGTTVTDTTGSATIAIRPGRSPHASMAGRRPHTITSAARAIHIQVGNVGRRTETEVYRTPAAPVQRARLTRRASP